MIGKVPIRGNYPFPGFETWSYIEVDHIPGFDAAAVYPHMRAEGDVKGRNMFRLAHHHVERRGIAVRLSLTAERPGAGLLRHADAASAR